MIARAGQAACSMLNIRLLMLSALMLAMAVTMLRPPPLLPVRLTLQAVDWREAKPALPCPSDSQEGCCILCGP